LTRRLPAPRALKRVSSEDEVWNHDGRGHRWTRRLVPGKPKSAKKLGAAFLRRSIEVGLAVVLAAVVLLGQERRALKEVLSRKYGAPDLIGRGNRYNKSEVLITLQRLFAGCLRILV
jgi:hypothetical protein